MYLIDDSDIAIHEAISGFSLEPGRAYLELWGLLQAIVIQQDAILALWSAISGTVAKRPRWACSWKDIRDLRNEVSGHPVNSRNGRYRCFLGRSFGNIERITYERYDIGGVTGSLVYTIRYISVSLLDLVRRYQREAAIVLYFAFRSMRCKW